MGDMTRRNRKRQMEPARIQYGAWDDPRVSLFATVPQEPVGDMMKKMKRLPPGSRDRVSEMDASPLVMAPQPSGNFLYREIKYQVQQIADDRNKNYHPIQERERQSALIAGMMAEQNRHEFTEAMRAKQIRVNSQRVRDLQNEIDRAKTTLSIMKKRQENQKVRGVERVEERKEALEHREQVRKEKLAEQQAMQQKTRDYSQQLVAQIRKLQADRAERSQTELEEGRQKRHNAEVAHANDLQQAMEQRHKKRAELKQMLDEFLELQRSIRERDPANPDKLDVIMLDAVNPITASFINKRMQQHKETIDRRLQLSEALGKKLREIQDKKDAHDNMLADILVCERQAREKKRAIQEIEKRQDQKLEVARDLIKQRKEQQLHREMEQALNIAIPTDATSFMQRQYKQAMEKEAASREQTSKMYETIAGEVENNARLRAVCLEEERMLMQALKDMEAEMERRIDEERMRMLHDQPREVIEEMRPCKLSRAECFTFNLPICPKDDDTHTH